MRETEPGSPMQFVQMHSSRAHQLSLSLISPLHTTSISPGFRRKESNSAAVPPQYAWIDLFICDFAWVAVISVVNTVAVRSGTGGAGVSQSFNAIGGGEIGTVKPLSRIIMARHDLAAMTPVNMCGCEMEAIHVDGRFFAKSVVWGSLEPAAVCSCVERSPAFLEDQADTLCSSALSRVGHRV